MTTRARYITEGEFRDSYYNCYPRRLYEGFIIGIGYAYIECDAEIPPNQNGFSPCPHDGFGDNIYRLSHVQQVDTSEEMRQLSLRASVSGEFVEIRIYKGDTLDGLARELGVTVDDLAGWNKIADRNTILAGQSLMVDVNKARFCSRLIPLSTGSLANLSRPIPETDGGNLSNSPGGFMYDFFLAAISTGIQSSLTVNNYAYMRSLSKKGQFIGINYGEAVVMDKSWISTKRMEQVRGPMRDSFNSNYARLRYLKWGGNFIARVSTYISIFELRKGLSWESGLDVGFSIGGFFYWPVAAMYGFGKGVYEGMLHHNLNLMENGLIPGKDDLIIWK